MAYTWLCPLDMKRCLVQRVDNLESRRIGDNQDKRGLILGINKTFLMGVAFEFYFLIVVALDDDDIESYG